MRIIKFIESLYLGTRVFYVLTALVLLFLFSYWLHALYPIALIGLWPVLLVVVFDILTLYKKKEGIFATRQLPEKFSNSDLNEVPLTIQNKYNFKVSFSVIDEIPVQFQKRDFLKKGSIPSRDQVSINYGLRPVDRG
ncbi:MAG: DUF58 domain-containing protein, partial [Leeuwenhoekiella sp.]|nr:DUF58 domain-containing protein [Leeuwenhoekiella sp.]